jgi:hypothetical protein
MFGALKMDLSLKGSEIQLVKFSLVIGVKT